MVPVFGRRDYAIICADGQHKTHTVRRAAGIDTRCCTVLTVSAGYACCVTPSPSPHARRSPTSSCVDGNDDDVLNGTMWDQ